MTVTLTIQPEIEKDLLAQASARGVSLVEYLGEVVVQQAQETRRLRENRTGQKLIDVSAKVRGLLSDE